VKGTSRAVRLPQQDEWYQRQAAQGKTHGIEDKRPDMLHAQTLRHESETPDGGCHKQ